MKRIFFAILIVLGLSTGQTKAQLSDKLVPHMGFMYEIISLDAQTANSGPNAPTTSFQPAFYTISLGTYYTLSHKNDVVSIGIDPSVNLGLNFVNNFNGGTSVNYVIQTPVFLMGRLGATATPYNQQKIGLGLGIGGTYSIFSFVDRGSRLSANFFNPSLVGEITILSGGSPLTIRGHLAFVDTDADLKTRPLNAGSDSITTFSFSNFGIGLIYGL